MVLAGSDEGSAGVHRRRADSGDDDRGALLLRSQRGLPDGAAEGVQPQEPPRLPLRHPGPRLHGTPPARSFFFGLHSSAFSGLLS